MVRLTAILLGWVIVLPAWAADISAGPMLGHVTSRTATIWIQTDGPAALEVRYWPARCGHECKLAPVVRLDAGTDYSAQVTLTDLKPGTRYLYEVFLDKEQKRRDASLDFTTLPPWRRWQGPPDFTIYLGSSACTDDPATDPPGKSYGSGYRIFETIARLGSESPRPHFMLWLGDHVCFRETDYESPWGMNARYRQARSLPELQPLLRAMPNYAIWDDHDYGPGQANRSFVFKDESLRLFRRYWANPSYGLEGLPGIYTTFSFLDADLFLLDDRYYRAADATAEPKHEEDLWTAAKDWAFGYNSLTRLLGKRYAGGAPVWLGESKVMFGQEQLDWLKQALIQSRATFKIIASANQLWNDANRDQGWQNFPGERDGFREWLKEQDIPGVIFVSGGRPHTELIRHEAKSGYPLYELACSPLTAPPRPPSSDKEKDNPQRVAGTLVGQRNFCTLDARGPADHRQLVMRAFDSTGDSLWEQTLTAEALGGHGEPPK
jgi:alkaline phosphatase D